MANNFSRFDQGIQIANGFASDPVTGLLGEIYYNTAKNLCRICTQVSPSLVWEDMLVANGTTAGSLLTYQTAYGTYAENLGVIVSGYSIGGIPDAGNNVYSAADVYISGSNKTAGTGNGGDLVLSGGSSSGGSPGNVLIEGNNVSLSATGLQVPTMSLEPLAYTASAAFTIPNTNSYVQLTSSTIVTSGTPAIANGLFNGMLMVLENVGGNNITLVNGGTLSLPLAANYTIAPAGTITLIWNGTLWRTIASSSN
jgi:hypothetical protein